MTTSAAPECPSCGGENPRKVGALPKVDVFAGQKAGGAVPAGSLYRCLACNLLFRSPVLSGAEYDALYGKVSTASWSDRAARTDWSLIVDHLSRNSAAGASVLDVGCHTGGLLRRLGTRYSLYGAEVNESAAQIARQTSGAQVFRGIEAIPRGRQFDVVTAVDVVEHFPDPGRLLHSLLEAVRPGGSLIVTTGDADNVWWRLFGARWWYCYYPEHVAFVSERWMRRWLQGTGTGVQLAEVRRFRNQRLGPLRYARQACLASVYLLAPRAYAGMIRMLKRVLGRQGDVDPPGAGLARDHVFLVLRKAA